MMVVLRKIKRLMCRRTRGSPPTGFVCTGEVCTNSQCEKGQCTTPKRLANMDGGSARKPQLNISQKELTSLLIPTSSIINHDINEYHSKRARGGNINITVGCPDLSA